LGGLGSGESVEVRAGNPGNLKDSLLHLLVFNEPTIDPEVRVVLVMLLGYQELLGKLGHLCIIIEKSSIDSSTSYSNKRSHGSNVAKTGHDIYKGKI